MRDFSSSTESLSDCICPEVVSSLPFTASFCVFSFCCSAFTVVCHLVGLVRRLLRQILQHAEALSPSWTAAAAPCPVSCCTWVCSSTISFETACAGTPAGQEEQRKSCRREKTIANCAWIFACFTHDNNRRQQAAARWIRGCRDYRRNNPTAGPSRFVVRCQLVEPRASLPAADARIVLRRLTAGPS